MPPIRARITVDWSRGSKSTPAQDEIFKKGTAYMHTWSCMTFLEALANGLFYERPQNPFMFLQGCIDRVVENERAGLTGPANELPRKWDTFVSKKGLAGVPTGGGVSIGGRSGSSITMDAVSGMSYISGISSGIVDGMSAGPAESARKKRKKKRRNRKDQHLGSGKGDRPDVAPGVAEMIKSGAASVPSVSSPLKHQNNHTTKSLMPIAKTASGGDYSAVASTPSTKVVIFDFDHTIATDQIDEEILENRASVCHGNPLGNRDRVEMLNNLLGELKASGVLCGIVTYNHRDVVKLSLKTPLMSSAEFDLYRHFEEELIFCADNVDVDDCYMKYEFVSKRFLQPLRLPPSQILFLDDSKGNVEDVIENCGVEAFQVKGESGLEHKGCEWIRKWALGGVATTHASTLGIPGANHHGGGAADDGDSAKGWDAEPVIMAPKKMESRHHGRDGRPMTPDPDEEAARSPKKNRSFLSRMFKPGSRVAPQTHAPTSDYNAVAQALFASLKLSSTGAATSVSGSVHGYRNMDMLWTNPKNKKGKGGSVFIGNMTACNDRGLLSAFNISRVVNCTVDLPNTFEKETWCKYLRFDPIPGMRKAEKDGLGTIKPQAVLKVWSKLFTYIDKATASGRNVLIHSLAGVHRAGMCAAAYLMHANELDMMKAIRILQEARPKADPFKCEELGMALENLGFVFQKRRSGVT